MRTTRGCYTGLAAVGIVLLLAGLPDRLYAQQDSDPASRIGNSDLGGIVTSKNGPEAGVWVIAETTDLSTRFAKIVVTDERGRYVILPPREALGRLPGAHAVGMEGERPSVGIISHDYWDDPEHEEVCEEVGQGIILIKDARGEIIGFERLYFKSSTSPHELGIVLQTART